MRTIFYGILTSFFVCNMVLHAAATGDMQVSTATAPEVSAPNALSAGSIVEQANPLAAIVENTHEKVSVMPVADIVQVPEIAAPVQQVAAVDVQHTVPTLHESVLGEHESLPLADQLAVDSVSQPSVSPVHAVQSVPTPVDPVTVTVQDDVSAAVEEPEIVGIDTVDIKEAQGNWLFKRIWWERAEAKYEKIRNRVAAVHESRMAFFSKRAEFDKKIINPFLVSIGISTGELQELLSQLTQQLEQARVKEGSLSDEERLLLKDLDTQKEALDRLKLGIGKILTLAQDIDNALETLIEQVNRVRAYEQESWQQFKEIARVLNDKKAREIFYSMDSLSKNVSNVASYIQQQFEPYFNNLMAVVHKEVEVASKTISELNKQGINFKEKNEQLRLLKSGKKQTKTVVPKTEKEDEQETEERGFFSAYFFAPLMYIWDIISTFFGAIYSWITSFFS